MSRTWVVVAAVAVLTVTGLAGCTGVRSEVHTTRLLEAEGYLDPGISAYQGADQEQVELSYRSTEASERVERERAQRAAEIVWDTLEVRISELVVVIEGSNYSQGELAYSRAGLRSLFGPRPPGLEERTTVDLRETVIKLGVGAVVVVGLTLIATVVVVVALARRARRGRAGPAWQTEAAGWVPVSDAVIALPPILAESGDVPGDPWAPPPG